jgi:hypothetical protein
VIDALGGSIDEPLGRRRSDAGILLLSIGTYLLSRQDRTADLIKSTKA